MANHEQLMTYVQIWLQFYVIGFQRSGGTSRILYKMPSRDVDRLDPLPDEKLKQTDADYLVGDVINISF